MSTKKTLPEYLHSIYFLHKLDSVMGNLDSKQVPEGFTSFLGAVQNMDGFNGAWTGLLQTLTQLQSQGILLAARRVARLLYISTCLPIFFWQTTGLCRPVKAVNSSYFQAVHTALCEQSFFIVWNRVTEMLSKAKTNKVLGITWLNHGNVNLTEFYSSQILTDLRDKNELWPIQLISFTKQSCLCTHIWFLFWVTSVAINGILTLIWINLACQCWILLKWNASDAAASYIWVAGNKIVWASILKKVSLLLLMFMTSIWMLMFYFILINQS